MSRLRKVGKALDISREFGEFGEYNYTVHFNGHKFPIGAGATDTVVIRKMSISGDTLLFIASINKRFGYAGLEIFSLRSETLTEGPFLQSDHDLESVLGKSGLDLNNISILSRLVNFWFECQ